MGHFVKGASQTRTPSRLAIVAIDRIEDQGQNVLGSWHLRYSRRRPDGYQAASKSFSGTDGAGLWLLLRQLCGQGSRLYCVIEDGLDGMTLAGFWSEIRTGRFSIIPHGSTVSDCLNRAGNKRQKWLPFIMSHTADVVAALHPGGQVRFVAPKNHQFDYDHKQTLQLLAGPDRGQLRGLGAVSFVSMPIEMRGKILEAYYKHCFRVWTDARAGSWQDTIGSLGAAWWRRHVGTKRVLIHDCEPAHSAECSSCYGGRQEVFFHGRQVTPAAQARWGRSLPKGIGSEIITSTLTEIDFRAMYVSIMRDCRFPVKLVDRIPPSRFNNLPGIMEFYDVIATVRLRTLEACYPYRKDRGVCYPTGSWLVTLTTPELRQAFQAGHIVEVYEAWQYETGYPFRDFANEALRVRWMCEANKDTYAGRLFKAASNALGGKLARRESVWKDQPKIRSKEAWGEFTIWTGDDSRGARARAIGGRVQVKEQTERRIPGLTACYAHLTAWGRVKAWEVLSAAGYRGCVYWDTDGGLFTPDGLRRIRQAGLVFGQQPGQLRICGQVKASVHRGIKRHWRDGTYVLSGIPDGFTTDSRGHVSWVQDVNPVRSGQSPDSSPFITVSSAIEFKSISPSAPVDDSGWSSPLVASSLGLVVPAEDSPIC